MPRYLPDTNVLIDFGRDPAFRCVLERIANSREQLVIAPPAITELVRGVIGTKGKYFAGDQQVFRWLHSNEFPILDLPRVFIARLLMTTTRKGGVVPANYAALIEMIAEATDFDDFLARSRGEGSVWTDIARADDIHNDQLDHEIGNALPRLVLSRGHGLAERLANTFGAPGCRPNPLIISRRFSAALEFLQSSLQQVSAGSKPRKNDPGMYVDFQLLFYLANPEVTFVTKEDFSEKIRRSEQRNRIIHPDALP